MSEFENTVDTSASTEATQPSLTESLQGADQTEQPGPLDIDSVERFRFNGREWTPKELKNAYMMHEDYTRKTQAISEERKYNEALRYDLEQVEKDPTLAEKFKQIYPEKYHAYLNYVLKNQAQQQVQPQQQSGMDPKFVERFERLEKSLREKEVAAIDAELEVKFKQLSEKYPFADEEVAITRAQNLINSGETLDDKAWDAIWKSVHDRVQKLSTGAMSKQVNQQKQLNVKGKDTGAGGGTAGQAPRRPKSLKEATDGFIQDASTL